MTVGGHTQSEKFSDLNVPISGLYLLAAPSTPAEAIEAAVKALGAPV
jgi:hypothetical protein